MNIKILNINMIFVLFLYSQTMFSSQTDIENLKNSIGKILDVQFGEVFNHMDVVINDVHAENRKIKEEMVKLGQIVDRGNTTLSIIINNHSQVLQQIIHGEALQDINVRAAELHQLKNQLCNELMHVQQYKNRIEEQLRLYKNRVERVELLYTALRCDVNVETVKQQINLFNSAAVNNFDEMQRVQENINKAIADYKNEIENADIQINKKLAVHLVCTSYMVTQLSEEIKACEMRSNGKDDKLKMFTISTVVILVLFIAYQQYQISLLKQHLSKQL